MYYTKKLIFLFLLFVIAFSGQKPFRGLEKEDILRTKVPMSFSHHISSSYDVLPQQLTPVRGSYLIIAREGLVNQGYIDVFAEFKKTQGFDVTVIELGDTELDLSLIHI